MIGPDRIEQQLQALLHPRSRRSYSSTETFAAGRRYGFGSFGTMYLHNFFYDDLYHDIKAEYFKATLLSEIDREPAPSKLLMGMLSHIGLKKKNINETSQRYRRIHHRRSLSTMRKGHSKWAS